MSKTQILERLPQLTREERRDIVVRVHELDGDEWLDEGALTAEDKALLEARVAEDARHPEAAIPWSEFCQRLNARLGK
jgi:hypothetical protein